jgi:hypothetical protein
MAGHMGGQHKLRAVEATPGRNAYPGTDERPRPPPPPPIDALVESVASGAPALAAIP